MACPLPCLGFIWFPIRGTLEDFLQRRAYEALTFAFNWIIEKVWWADSRVFQANFPHSIVGAEEPLSEIRRLLEDEDSKIIGIYGMGGVGKTTLLKTINDEYLQTRSELFDIVIFVAVSKVVLIDSIQKEIGKTLGLEVNLGHGTTSRATVLFNGLRKKKFLLLLDDLWEKLDLAAVGIPYAPYSKKGSKVVFTTRSIRVCNAMDAAQSKIKVPFLSPEKSWELFCQILRKGNDQWTKSTRPVAEAVAARCGGLPLALIVVARAMADTTIKEEWEDALKTIRGTAAEFEEIKEEVLPILKFSFDRLKDEEHKACLLYCSLFVEDDDIFIDQLIEYWIGEGLLGSLKCSLDTARKRGLAAINTLKSVCLLEGNSFGGFPTVKLHDMVREMALWITSGIDGKEKITFLVKSREKLVSAPMSERWADATRISLMYNHIKELHGSPRCDNLRTLLLNDNTTLRHIHSGFFQFMPLLTVLDLSFTCINLLPSEIGLLVDLTFLNLSFTLIESLPVEVGRLKKLTILNLLNTYKLKTIPDEAISTLSSLRLLNIDYTGYQWRGGWKGDLQETGVCFRDLDRLKQLEELHLTIEIMYHEDWCGLMNSRILLLVVRDLRLKGLSTSSIDWSRNLEDLKELRRLEIKGCLELQQMIFPADKIRKLEYLRLSGLPLETISWRIALGGAIFENLKVVQIYECKSLKEITWIKDLLHLDTLELAECNDMVEIIRVEEADFNGIVNKRDSFFRRLVYIGLDDMPNLKTICTQVLLFPSLQNIYVTNCPELKKLPFGSDSAHSMKKITGEPWWWDGLEWDDQSIRSKFTSYFVPSLEYQSQHHQRRELIGKRR